MYQVKLSQVVYRIFWIDAESPELAEEIAKSEAEDTYAEQWWPDSSDYQVIDILEVENVE